MERSTQPSILDYQTEELLFIVHLEMHLEQVHLIKILSLMQVEIRMTRIVHLHHHLRWHCHNLDMGEFQSWYSTRPNVQSTCQASFWILNDWRLIVTFDYISLYEFYFNEIHLCSLYNDITFIMTKMLFVSHYKPVTKQVPNIRT